MFLTARFLNSKRHEKARQGYGDSSHFMAAKERRDRKMPSDFLAVSPFDGARVCDPQRVSDRNTRSNKRQRSVLQGAAAHRAALRSSNWSTTDFLCSLRSFVAIGLVDLL
jgi:hypothetical protein